MTVERTNGKTVLVTAVDHYVGAETAKAFANQGYRLALHVTQSTPEAQALLSQLQGNTHMLLSGDLANSHTPATLIHETIETFGQLDCLVCNTSTLLCVSGDSDSQRTDSIHHAITTHLLTPILMTQALSQVSHQPHPPSVVLLSKQEITSSSNYFGYAISQAALRGCVHYLARVLAPKLRVNMIESPLINESQSTVNFDKSHSQTALDRANEVENTTKAALWLCQNHTITGQIITIA